MTSPCWAFQHRRRSGGTTPCIRTPHSPSARSRVRNRAVGDAKHESVQRREVQWLRQDRARRDGAGWPHVRPRDHAGCVWHCRRGQQGPVLGVILSVHSHSMGHGTDIPPPLLTVPGALPS
jgi:hypothetical protein